MTTPPMNGNGHYKRYDYRCPNCGRLWFRAHLVVGVMFWIRCHRCNLFFVIGKDNEGVFIRDDTRRLEYSETVT